MPQNNLREVKKIIYSLKRKYGLQMTVVRPNDDETEIDYTTGRITRSYDQVVIRRGILLPANRKRTFIYDLAYIAANNNFTYGGLFDKNEREVIIEAKDLKGLEIDTSSHIVTQNKRYEILNINEFEDMSSYVLKVRAIQTAEDLIISDNIMTTTSVTASTFSPIITAPGTATWIFGDGNEETSNTPSHTYADAGEKTVRIRGIALNTITAVDWSSQDLTSVKLGALTAMTSADLSSNDLVYVDLSSDTLDTVDLTSNATLEHVKIDNTPLLIDLNVSDCALTTDNLNSIFQYLDNFGLSNGTFNWTSNANDPSGQTAQDAYDSLVSKGWTLSGVPPIVSYVTASGGTVVDYNESGTDYRAHIFTVDGTFTVTEGGFIDYLVVGGGGAGSQGTADVSQGGGGGAGGFIEDTTSVTVQAYSVVVGAGGVGSNGAGTDGGNSSFDGTVAEGGGAGGNDNGAGNDGGSGGGASGNDGIEGSPPERIGGQGTVGQGNNGGNSDWNLESGGGGGAGQVGEASINGKSGDGGDGLTSTFVDGTPNWYAGGGGGGFRTVAGTPGAGTPATGGGGAGSNNGGTGGDGVPNTGGGGGGSGRKIDGGRGGHGGSGIVVIRYEIP